MAATKSNLYLLSPISGLYECDIIYQDSESSVFSGESLFFKSFSVFYHSSLFSKTKWIYEDMCLYKNLKI